MKHLYCLMAFMLSLPGALSSQNPVINHCFTADPTARVFNGKIYMQHPDGTPVERILPAGGYTRVRHSLGLVSTAAAVSLASTRELSHEFVSHMWNSRHEPYDDGYFDAYYDGLLHLFAFMHLSGKYRIIVPTAESDSHR